MKPHLDIKHEGTIDGERKRMSINPEDFTHLMSMVTDLYSDPILACVREYPTNALDSHIEAGNPEPIRIYLPTGLVPVYMVRDFGVGMSFDDIMETFAMYGRSTKRESDSVAGMWGLGCKAALTYTSQFTVEAIKNGEKVTVLVTREEDGAGAVEVVDKIPTDEPNGVTIQIPVKDTYEFSRKTKNFFRFWTHGTVMVDDAFLPSFFGNNSIGDMQLDPDVTLTTDLNQDYLVMGNVPYPVPYGEPALVETRKTAVRAVVRVPIGSIDFTPSREALHMTNRTIETLHDARSFISRTVAYQANKEVDEAPDHLSALAAADKWRGVYPGPYKYRGGLVPSHVPIDRQSTFRWRMDSTSASRPRSNYIDLNDALDAWHVVGFTGAAFTAVTKEKIRLYAEQNGIESDLVFTHATKVGTPWLDEQVWVRWDDVKKVQLPDDSNAKRTKHPKYRRLNNATGSIMWTNEIPDDVKLLWISAQEYRSYRYLNIKTLPSSYAVMILLASQEKMFTTKYGATPLREFVGRVAETFVNRLTPMESYVIRNKREFESKGLAALNPNRVHDPELANLLRSILRVSPDLRPSWDKIIADCQLLGIVPPTLPKSDVLPIITQLEKRYPLLAALGNHLEGRRYAAELTEYVNAIYITSSGLHLSRAC